MVSLGTSWAAPLQRRQGLGAKDFLGGESKRDLHRSGQWPVLATSQGAEQSG